MQMSNVTYVPKNVSTISKDTKGIQNVVHEPASSVIVLTAGIFFLLVLVSGVGMFFYHDYDRRRNQRDEDYDLKRRESIRSAVRAKLAEMERLENEVPVQPRTSRMVSFGNVVEISASVTTMSMVNSSTDNTSTASSKELANLNQNSILTAPTPFMFSQLAVKTDDPPVLNYLTYNANTRNSNESITDSSRQIARNSKVIDIPLNDIYIPNFEVHGKRSKRLSKTLNTRSKFKTGLNYRGLTSLWAGSAGPNVDRENFNSSNGKNAKKHKSTDKRSNKNNTLQQSQTSGKRETINNSNYKDTVYTLVTDGTKDSTSDIRLLNSNSSHFS